MSFKLPYTVQKLYNHTGENRDEHPQIIINFLQKFNVGDDDLDPIENSLDVNEGLCPILEISIRKEVFSSKYKIYLVGREFSSPFSIPSDSDRGLSCYRSSILIATLNNNEINYLDEFESNLKYLRRWFDYLINKRTIIIKELPITYITDIIKNTIEAVINKYLK